jgi:hypothetical protein
VAPLDLAWPPQCSWLARPHASLRPGPGFGRSEPSGAHDSSPPRLVTVCWVDVVSSSLVQGLNQYAVVPIPHGTDNDLCPCTCAFMPTI